MSRKKILFVTILFLFGFLSMIPPTLGGSKPATISTIASKDSYVRQYNPTSNYGGQDWFLLGRDVYSAAMEAYFYFDFSDKPSSWTKAEISIDFYSIPSTTNVTVYLIENSWEELTITWNNKPSKGEIITSFLIAAEDPYIFDVSSYIAGRSAISICLWTPEVFSSYHQIQGTAKEGYYSWAPENAPQLIWTYPETTSVSVTSPTSSTRKRPGMFTYITWTTQGPIDEVDIHILKGGVTKYHLLRTANDGSYFWDIPDDIETGTDWQIRVRDSDDTNTYNLSEEFEIYTSSIPNIPGYQFPLIILSIIVISGILIKKKFKMT
ncbi:MAG: CBM96 family carbohydrate-binding protein [Promethearchaeota archaeon]